MVTSRQLDLSSMMHFFPHRSIGSCHQSYFLATHLDSCLAGFLTTNRTELRATYSLIHPWATELQHNSGGSSLATHSSSQELGFPVPNAKILISVCLSVGGHEDVNKGGHADKKSEHRTFQSLKCQFKSLICLFTPLISAILYTLQHECFNYILSQVNIQHMKQSG